MLTKGCVQHVPLTVLRILQLVESDKQVSQGLNAFATEYPVCKRVECACILYKNEFAYFKIRDVIKYSAQISCTFNTGVCLSTVYNHVFILIRV